MAKFISRLFGGGSTPQAPPPPPPTRDTAAETASAELEANRKRLRGRASTILTSDTGVEGFKTKLGE